jgi:hypothetical protein
LATVLRGECQDNRESGEIRKLVSWFESVTLEVISLREHEVWSKTLTGFIQMLLEFKEQSFEA